jgi:hypothetical protein
MTNKNLTDLPDSEKDQAKLQPEEAVLDLPDVKDIPGQENIHVPELREMADTTISSDDEEGTGIFGDDDEDYASERMPVGEELDEDDLVIDDDELDEEESDNDTEDDELDITDDSVDEDSDVTDEEKEALERTEQMDTPDNEELYNAELDDTDFDGEKLNESEDFSGKDLDVPGAEADDDNEEIGEEDEQNNEYSLGDNV